jgi:GNAT superfamily N-acetyltransferase
VESVRVAGPADGPRCAALWALARQALRDQRGGQRLLETAGAEAPFGGGTGPLGDGLRHWTEHPASPDRRLLVGEFDGVVVGMAAGVVEPRATPTSGAAGSDPPRPTGRIAVCFVEGPARGVGVGTALVDALVAWFVVSGCTDVEALALPGDRATKQLYEANGLKARLLVLHRPLP